MTTEEKKVQNARGIIIPDEVYTWLMQITTVKELDANSTPNEYVWREAINKIRGLIQRCKTQGQV